MKLLGLCVFLKENPDKVDDWLNGKTNLVTTIESFRLIKKIFRVEGNKQIDKLIGRTYGHLCNYVHGNSLANVYTVTNIEENEEGRGYALQLPARLKEEEVNGLWDLSLAMVYALFYLFEDDLTKQQKLKLGHFILRELKDYLKLPMDKLPAADKLP